jgi:hypothetical protein
MRPLSKAFRLRATDIFAATCIFHDITRFYGIAETGYDYKILQNTSLQITRSYSTSYSDTDDTAYKEAAAANILPQKSYMKHFWIPLRVMVRNLHGNSTSVAASILWPQGLCVFFCGLQ